MAVISQVLCEFKYITLPSPGEVVVGKALPEIDAAGCFADVEFFWSKDPIGKSRLSTFETGISPPKIMTKPLQIRLEHQHIVALKTLYRSLGLSQDPDAIMELFDFPPIELYFNKGCIYLSPNRCNPYERKSHDDQYCRFSEGHFDPSEQWTVTCYQYPGYCRNNHAYRHIIQWTEGGKLCSVPAITIPNYRLILLRNLEDTISIVALQCLDLYSKSRRKWGNGGQNGVGFSSNLSIASSASLHLYTFFAMLVLLSVSAAIVIRSFLLRRRIRTMMEAVVCNGT
ncbi:hypothetical protein BDQ12DRAFT_769449 [Crucibulum laeve]|uniref:Uncharacterized protein n=1 Tax=Crucibulum laeve TaxID=68775 RepID=A0A5C3LMD6_9AGAR|nr:hypothetical protein BDQ12DRAFT_769449 [Crucibulum laeve]